MQHPFDKPAGETVCDPDGADAGEARAGISTYTIVEDELVVVVEIFQGTGPFSAAELDVYERYMAHILDEVLGK